MKKLILFITFLLSFASYGDVKIKTKIYKIYEPSGGAEDYLILAMNGNVYGIPSQQIELINMANEALVAFSAIEIELENQTSLAIKNDERATIKSMKRIDSSERFEVPFGGFDPSDQTPNMVNYVGPMYGYDLTTMSQSGVNSLFRSMRNDLRGGSECYNRAHVWNWEMYKKQGVYSGKMFLFFTRKYIREYNYKWWFHAAPFVGVNGESQHVVLDRQYMGTPRVMHSWTDVFMKNNAQCAVVNRYSSYSEHEYKKYCYLIPASMYYWQPWHVEYLEKYGTRRTYFRQKDINHAYRDAL